ncbi:MAG: hypothetical protein WDN49_26865 [Acetobacteraceae bacterium]
MVYDLQTSGRSGWYYRVAGRPAWSGIAAGSSHPHANPARDSLHTLERQREQLTMAGITAFPPPALDWLTQPGSPPDLPTPYALLIPGAAPHRPRKRWPAGHFGTLAAQLAARTQTPIIVGSAQDAPLAAAIRGRRPRPSTSPFSK